MIVANIKVIPYLFQDALYARSRVQSHEESLKSLRTFRSFSPHHGCSHRILQPVTPFTHLVNTISSKGWEFRLSEEPPLTSVYIRGPLLVLMSPLDGHYPPLCDLQKYNEEIWTLGFWTFLNRHTCSLNGSPLSCNVDLWNLRENQELKR